MRAYLRGYPEYFGDTPGARRRPDRLGGADDDSDRGRHARRGSSTSATTISSLSPRSRATSTEPETVEATELIEGRNYFIVLTTAGGLYRYNISDLVRCVGYHGKTPLIEFLNKGAHYSSLTGEKLSEHQVIAAVEAAQQHRSAFRLQVVSTAPRPGTILRTIRSWSRRATW